MNIDDWRKLHMSVAELLDTWRVIPRLLVAGYAYVTWKVVQWYMAIEPKMIEGCDVASIGEACISQGPNTQHAVLITAIVGVVAAVFGLYTSTGKDWGKGFISWLKKDEKKDEE